MKGWVLGIFILGIVFVSACNLPAQRTLCGDGICDSTESCACSDCANTDFCKVKNVTQNCDDSNDCTIDSFNPSTNSCVREIKQNCCGNSKCELDERDCNFNTYETKCGKDCGLSCPPKLIVHQSKETKTEDKFSFVCADANCEKTGDNNFRMKKYAAVQTVITNIGEQSTDVITSSFSCQIGSTKIALNDNDNYNGIIFKDFFNEREDKLDSLSSRINLNNNAIYKLSINITNQITTPLEIVCSTVLASNYLQNIQELKITIY